MAAAIQVEDYRLVKEAPAPVDPKAAKRNRPQRFVQLEAVGLTRVKEREEHDGPRFDTAQTFYPELQGKALKVWRAFLSTAYTKLQRYEHDSPPDGVVALMIFAKQLGCFDSVQIWTPEGNTVGGRLARNFDNLSKRFAMLDPMVVGVIKDTAGVERYFQIARWGEALQPFEVIKRYVRKVDMQMWLIRSLLLAVPVGLYVWLCSALGIHGTQTIYSGPSAGKVVSYVDPGHVFGLVLVGIIVFLVSALAIAATEIRPKQQQIP